MSSYIKKLNISTQIRENLQYFMYKNLLERGYYFNITSGTTDWQGNSLGRLSPNTNDEMLPGNSAKTYVWESVHNNFIYESGIDAPSGMTTPTIASGVYIGSTFFPRQYSAGGSGIEIDYARGRAIIVSGIPSNYDVFMNFAYKTVYITDTSRVNIAQLYDYLTDNAPYNFGNINFPSGNAVQLPMIVLENTGRSSIPYQLGDRSRFIREVVTCWVISNNAAERDDLIDFLNSLEYINFDMADFGNIPAQWTFYGDRSSGVLSYQDMQSQYFYKNAYITSADVIRRETIGTKGFYQGRVDLNIEIIDINP